MIDIIKFVTACLGLLAGFVIACIIVVAVIKRSWMIVF